MTKAPLIALLFIASTILPTAGQTKPSQVQHPQLTLSEKTTIPGFPYPQEQLINYRDSQNIVAIRQHAWTIFSALVSQAAYPEWEHWYTKCDVPLEVSACPQDRSIQETILSLRGLEIPRQSLDKYTLPPEARKENLLFDMSEFLKGFRLQPNFASVFFNPEAARYIRTAKINQVITLANLLKGQAGSDPVSEITPFPSNAIAVKTIWEQVVPSQDSSPKSKTWVLHLWDPDMLNRASALPTGGTLDNLTSDQASLISVDLNTNHLCRNVDYSSNIPIRCFHFQEVRSLVEFRKIYPLLSLLEESSVRPPFFLVLVGVHIATKETPDWTWSTFYWSKKAFSDPMALDHPRSLTGPWSHFVMNATLSADTPRNKKPDGPNICYNPYLEGKFANGLSSNCLFCHAHASYTASPDDRVSSTQIGSPQYYDGVRHVSEEQERAFFSSALKTGFLWSIADMGLQDKQNEFFKELTLFKLTYHLK